jgi:hypothetical protein
MPTQSTLDFTALIREKVQDFTGREWVFEAIDRWLGDPASNRVFLITGEPGSGKTALVAKLATMSQPEARRAGYVNLGAGVMSHAHFCSSEATESVDPQTFVESLSFSLARSLPGFGAALAGGRALPPFDTGVNQVAVGRVVLNGLSSWSSFETAVSAPMARLARSGFAGRIVVMVDALDEAWTFDPADNLPILIARTVVHAGDFPSQMRFLLTSRSDPRVLRYIGTPALDLMADAPADRDEVVTYAATQLTALGVADPVSSSTRIGSASHGNFLFARCTIDSIASGQHLEDAVEITMPQSVNDFYRYFLKRELGRDEALWHQRYQPLLGTLAVAQGEGLMPRQLAGITGLLQSETDSALRVCAQYLRGQWPTGPFHLYHWSFVEFLLTDAQFNVGVGIANHRIADFYMREFSGDWARCDDIYCLRFLIQHMLAFIGMTQNPKADHESIGTLVSLLTDADFLHARRKYVSKEAVLFETNAALTLVRKHSPESLAPLAQLQALQSRAEVDGG